MKEVKISNIQLGLLAFGFLYGSTAVTNLAFMAKRDAWIAALLGAIGGFALITMYLYISKLNAGKSLTQILEGCFGVVIGKAISLLYIWHFLHLASINLRGFGEFMATVSYPETPLIALLLTLMIAVVYIVRSGFETIGRISEIIVPIIPLPIIIVSTAMMTLPTFTGLKPVLVEIAPVLRSAFSVMTLPFGDFVTFLMILPYTNKPEGRFKAVYIAFFAFVLLFMLITLRNTIVIGPVLIEYMMYPSHISAQLIPGMSIDPLVDINLMVGGGLKITLFLYAATKATAEIFKFENYMPLVSPFAVFTIVLAIWIFPNALEIRKWVSSIYGTVYTVPFQVIFPALMLIISVIKNRRKAVRQNCSN